MHEALDGTDRQKVIWMPAHKTLKTAGQFKCSNGAALSAKDINGNAEADRLAKLAVEQHRVDPADVASWREQCESTRKTAIWVAKATWAANNCSDEPYRDSEASRCKADIAKKHSQAEKAQRQGGCRKTGGGSMPGFEARDLKDVSGRLAGGTGCRHVHG